MRAIWWLLPVLAGLILLGIIISGPLSGVLSNREKAEILQFEESSKVPTFLTKIAASAASGALSEENKQVLRALLEMQEAEPYQIPLILYRYNFEVTPERVLKLKDVVEKSSKNVKITAISDVASRCQLWGSIANLGEGFDPYDGALLSKFEEDALGSRPNSLFSASGIVKALNDKWETFKAFCGEECPETEKCKECYDVVAGKAEEDGLLTEEGIDLSSGRLEELRRCAESCALACDYILRYLSPTTIVGERSDLLKEALIGGGIQLP